ncbi:PQ loop repeat protein [Apiospora rasikravindrae]|uniref:PQ loop repeat protein n=1 Tax=Apiospora rasikravindrae TaxID=990691 RepID=A0ABR1RRA0_9PEZI
MAPQTDIPVAANVLGTIGTILWCIQLVPQIWTNWRTKKTDGLPASMMFLWAACAVPFGVYAIIQNFNIPIQVQPQCFGILSIVAWAQILMYSYKWATWKATVLGVVVTIAFGGIEAALILTLRGIYERGNETPPIVSPPYGEIWKRRGRVVGIDWVFLSMDCSGAFFSLMALVAQNTFDILGGVLYCICCALELGIFASHLIWLLRTRQVRRDAKAQGKTFDELAAEYEEKGEPFKFAERKSKAKKTTRINESSDVEAAGSDGSNNEALSREQSDAEKQPAGNPEHARC